MSKVKFLVTIMVSLVLISLPTLANDTYCKPQFIFVLTGDDNAAINFINDGFITINNLQIILSDECYSGGGNSNFVYNVSIDDNYNDLGNFEIISIENKNFIDVLEPNSDILRPKSKLDLGKITLKPIGDLCPLTPITFFVFYDNVHGERRVQQYSGLIHLPFFDIEYQSASLEPDIRYLDKDTFLANLNLFIKIKKNSLSVLYQCKNLLLNLSISYNNELYTFEFDENKVGYFINLPIRLNGSSYLYPIDLYSTVLYAQNFNLSNNIQDIPLNEDAFKNKIEYKDDQIIVTKYRNVFIPYSLGLVVFLLLLYFLHRYFSQPKIKINSPFKQFEIFVTVVGIIGGVCILFSFTPLNTLVSIGLIPFLFGFMFLIYSYVTQKNKDTKK